VASLLEKLAGATGLSPEALLNESIVRTGFTFARHVELAGALYLHTYFFYDQSFLGLIAGYLLQVPRGVTAYADHMLSDYRFKCVPLHLELADIVVATSRRIKAELGAIGGGRFDDKIIVKPNGIDVARFPVIAPEARLAAGGVPELIAVNRIEPKKGLIHLIDAMGLLKARGVAARLNLVGGADVHTPSSADCYRQLLARIDQLQLGDAVVLHGVKQQHEFAPLMARSRLFVAPYVEVNTGDKDGIPTAVLEAMSSGLPVVATDAGSLHECVADGVEGIAVPQRDPERLAEAIERLLTDHALFTRMSHAARQRAVSEFDIHVTELKLHERIRVRLAGKGA
jgi:colanic acid/amylovoran biosynthesis glycosyltransferase